MLTIFCKTYQNIKLVKNTDMIMVLDTVDFN